MEVNQKTKKIKVLHLITELSVGGAQDNTLLTIENATDKFDTDLMANPQGGFLSRAKNITGKLFPVFSLKREISPLDDIIALFKVYKFLRDHRYDIIHTHSSKAGIIGRIAGKLSGVPVIIHTVHGYPFHDFMSPFKKKFFQIIEKFVALFSTKILTVCSSLIDEGVECGIAPFEKFRVAYSGIDFSRFKKLEYDRSAICQKYAFPNDKFLFFMVGRLYEQKAPENFVKIVSLFRKRFPELFERSMFYIVGDGPLRKNTENCIEEEDLVESLKILGFIDEMNELYSVMDCFVLPSKWEGLGRALTESQYYKIPCVVSGVNGVVELIENNVNGFLLNPLDFEGFVEKMAFVMQNPGICESFKEISHKKVITMFDHKKMVEVIENTYIESLGEK